MKAIGKTSATPSLLREWSPPNVILGTSPRIQASTHAGALGGRDGRHKPDHDIGLPRGRRSSLFPVILMLVIAICGCARIANAQPSEVTFDLKIEKGRVAQNMRLIRVRQGDAVRLRWTTDRPIMLHLHGYDIEKKVEPGTVTEMAFTARITGRFPVEEHKLDARGGHAHGEAPLVRIEVRPR